MPLLQGRLQVVQHEASQLNKRKQGILSNGEGIGPHAWQNLRRNLQSSERRHHQHVPAWQHPACAVSDSIQLFNKVERSSFLAQERKLVKDGRPERRKSDRDRKSRRLVMPELGLAWPPWEPFTGGFAKAILRKRLSSRTCWTSVLRKLAVRGVIFLNLVAGRSFVRPAACCLGQQQLIIVRDLAG